MTMTTQAITANNTSTGWSEPLPSTGASHGAVGSPTSASSATGPESAAAYGTTATGTDSKNVPPEIALQQAMAMLEDALAQERKGREATRELQRETQTQALDERRQAAWTQLVAGLASAAATIASSVAAYGKATNNTGLELGSGIAQGISQGCSAGAAGFSSHADIRAQGRTNAAGQLKDIASDQDESVAELRGQRQKTIEAYEALARAVADAEKAAVR